MSNTKKKVVVKDEVVAEVVSETPASADIETQEADGETSTPEAPVVEAPVVPEQTFEQAAKGIVPEVDTSVKFDLTEAIYPGEKSERVMWLRDKLGCTPGDTLDAEGISAVKRWERDHGYGGFGIVNLDLWNEIFS